MILVGQRVAAEVVRIRIPCAAQLVQLAADEHVMELDYLELGAFYFELCCQGLARLKAIAIARELDPR